MKLKSLSVPQNLHRHRGVALVTALTVIALTTIVVLSFLSLAVSERDSASVYSDGINAEHLANAAINVAISQVRSATGDPSRLWASQPGAIRTYEREGRFAFGYKLYSDDLLTISDELASVLPISPHQQSSFCSVSFGITCPRISTGFCRCGCRGCLRRVMAC